MTRPEAFAPFPWNGNAGEKKRDVQFVGYRDKRREFERTFLRTCASTAWPEPPHISVAAAVMEAATFSVTMRFASACARFPPPAIFMILSPTTRCASKESIVASYQNLNIENVPSGESTKRNKAAA